MYTFDGNWNKHNITFNLLYTKTRFIDQSFSHSGPDVIFRHIGITNSLADEIANCLQHLFLQHHRTCTILRSAPRKLPNLVK